MTIVSDLLDLVFPAVCVSCSRPGTAWCSSCRPRGTPFLAHTAVPMPVFAAAEYDGSVRTALLQYKEHRNRSMAAPLAEHLGRVLASARLAGIDTATLVPVPSRRAAARQRGGDHVAALARPAAQLAGSRVLTPLRLLRGVSDSAGLTADQRYSNLAERMVARPPHPGETRELVIVDDIVTTGATLLEAKRALARAGWYPRGAAVVAATARRYPAGQSSPAVTARGGRVRRGS